MKRTIWQQLKKPLMVMAPLADVTDAAFRPIINKYGKPDLLYTEFVSADGLCSGAGRPKLMRELSYTPAEHPIIGQIFGSKPENIKTAAALLRELGFDGIDINMGCPDEGIEKQKAGAALIKNPELAKEIIAAAKEGAGELPVSVKTRIGYNEVQIEKWTAALLESKPAAITFHLRTRKEMSKVAAHWELIRVPVEMAKGTGTLILGNGDVRDLEEARAKAQEYGIDGVMLGRAIFGNPWLFSGRTGISMKERLSVMVEHAKLFQDLFCAGETNTRLFQGHTKNFQIMRKHMKAYCTGFEGAVELRAALMEVHSAQEVEALVAPWYAK